MALDKDLIDKLLEGYQKPEDLIGANELLKQLTKALVERALSAEMTLNPLNPVNPWLTFPADDSIDGLNEDVKFLVRSLLRLAHMRCQCIYLNRCLLLRIDECAADDDQVPYSFLVPSLDFCQRVDGIFNLCEAFFSCHGFHECTPATLTTLIYNNMVRIGRQIAHKRIAISGDLTIW
jgi:hypothetical protein